MTQYWFARYRTGANVSRGLVPLTWQGRAVIAVFVGGMVLGGLLFLQFGLRDQFFPGIVLFVVCAAVGAAAFLWAAATRSDPVKTVAEYRAERTK